MRVTILGSGTSIPKADRASPGFVLEFDGGGSLLVDPSSGSLHRMEKAGLPVTDLRWVFVSHFHPDHIGDLVPLFFALRNDAYFPTQSLTLVGPFGTRDLYARLLDVFGYLLPMDSFRLEIHEIAGGEAIDQEHWKVRAFAVEHTANSLGFRFEGPQSRIFAYSGDTDECSNLIPLLSKADIALVDCSQPSSLKLDGHLTPELAGKVALKAGVKHLILTHFYPVCDNYDLIAEVRSSGYSRPAELASDGMQIEL